MHCDVKISLQKFSRVYFWVELKNENRTENATIAAANDGIIQFKQGWRENYRAALSFLKKFEVRIEIFE